MDDELEGLKAIQRTIWSSGDYDSIAELFWDVGAVVAEAAAIEPGMQVLDVATGTGNAAIRAAEAGADVVGLDLTPELFADARRHEVLAGVRVEWREGDAEALPFEDARFDRVLSTFGVMFAPRHEVAAAELVLTCRPGGRVVLANWTPDGFLGGILVTLGRYLPPPPSAAAPTLWGEEGHVRALLGDDLDLELERAAVEAEFSSADELIAGYEQRFGPLIVARRVLAADRYDALLAELRTLVEGFRAGDRELRIPAEYLLVVGRKP